MTPRKKPQTLAEALFAKTLPQATTQNAQLSADRNKQASASAAAAPLLLYIHVPFCRSKCGYCSFYSEPLAPQSAADDVAAYLAALLGEIKWWGKRLKAAEVATVFFGGGTPSLLPAKALRGVLDAVRTHFTLAKNAEISSEANPESALADAWLFEARAAGITRLSLGVQSFSDADLARLGRVHDSRTAEAAVHTARAAGFSNISIDLMWGLPGPPGRPQAQMQWLAQLEKAVELKPNHISAYGFTLEEGTPIAAAVETGEFTLPDEKQLASMYMAGADLLESAGFMQYEISNYARMGFECRHNQGYWQGTEYLGLGPGATSTLHGKRWTHPPSIGAWRKAVTAGKMALHAETLSHAALIKEHIMLGLRTTKGISTADYTALTGRAFGEDFAAILKPLQRNGLASGRNGRFRLSRSGMLVSDAILAHFFELIEAAEHQE